MDDWEAKRKAREAIELEAESRLKARGHQDPRHKSSWLEAGMYDEMKRYDTLLAQEIIRIMQKSSVSVPEIPDNLKTKRDWASSAYDR